VAVTRSAAQHIRSNTGVLAALEKRVLVWIAGRLPRWTNSDHLSGLGLVGMMGVGGSFAVSQWWPAALLLVPGGLAVNWFGDSLDGTLARVRDQQRPRYGYYLDHVLDIVGTACLFAGLVLGQHMAPATAAVVLAAYVAVMAETFLATAARGRFRMACLGMGPTELRVLLAIGAVAVWSGVRARLPLLGPMPLFEAGGLLGACGLVGVFVVSAATNARALYLEEPMPPRRAGGNYS